MTEVSSPSVSLVIPTLGKSPYLRKCLESVRTAAGHEVEIVVVAQGPTCDEVDLALADRTIRRADNLGFAESCNLGLAACNGDYVGLVNDDALVAPDWLERLVRALDQQPDVAAVQGVNLQLHDERRLDGCGIGWNWAWRPVQLGFGAAAAGIDRSTPHREIFGVSGTAAIYRRTALDEVALGSDWFFDPRLRSYYEDVELAVRLRQRGYRALLVPAARAHHAGSVTSRQFPAERLELLSSNRYLVAARLFGRERGRRMRSLRSRDVIDLVAAFVRGRRETCRGILAGWKRARRLLPEFAHDGPPALGDGELEAFRVGRASDFR